MLAAVLTAYLSITASCLEQAGLLRPNAIDELPFHGQHAVHRQPCATSQRPSSLHATARDGGRTSRRVIGAPHYSLVSGLALSRRTRSNDARDSAGEQDSAGHRRADEQEGEDRGQDGTR